jgi:hypothetical protein
VRRLSDETCKGHNRQSRHGEEQHVDNQRWRPSPGRVVHSKPSTIDILVLFQLLRELAGRKVGYFDIGVLKNSARSMSDAHFRGMR